MNIFLITRFIIMSLVFSFLLSSCFDYKPKYSDEIEIVWENNKAVKLAIPKKALGELDPSQLQVEISPSKGIPILGGVESIDNNPDLIVFKPLIPFTRGMTYLVKAGNKTIGIIDIPGKNLGAGGAKVIAVYPTSDSIPENLLKIYIEFSHPMREGESLQHLALIKNGRDTLQSVFLDLQPELWNNDRTILTVWLDPGRIKRGLQPNLLLGPPLTRGNHYTLIVKQDWKNEEGDQLMTDYVKNFTTVNYDSLSPDPAQWKIKIPKEGTTNAMEIDFKESLDYLLVRNAIHIINALGMEVAGDFTVNPNESGCSFIPFVPWSKGEYYIKVESRMEDQAGNNLHRLFDEDLTVHEKNNSEKDFEKLIRIE